MSAMYGRHRAILKANGKVAVAGKSSPDAEGGSYQPMGRWEFDGKEYSALIRKPEDWYSPMVLYKNMLRFSAATKKELRDLILSYYDEER